MYRVYGTKPIILFILSRKIRAKVLGDKVGHALRVEGAVNLDHPDIVLAGRAHRVLGDEAVAIDAVALSALGVTDPGEERPGSWKGLQLALAKRLGRDHHHHPTRRIDDRKDKLGPEPPAFGDDRAARSERSQVVERPLEADRKTGQG